MDSTRLSGGAAEPELPELEPGVRLLDVAGDDSATGPLHALVLDHLLPNDGPAWWVDAGGHAVAQSLAAVAGVADRRDVPVLLTRSKPDAFAEPLAAAADETLTREQTALGPRFSGDGFEALVYPTGDGAVQTTLAFWKRVLSARRPAHGPAESAATPREVTVDGSH